MKKRKGLQRVTRTNNERAANTSFSGNLSEQQDKGGSKWKPMEETEDMLLRELKTDKERMKARNQMIIKRDFT